MLYQGYPLQPHCHLETPTPEDHQEQQPRRLREPPVNPSYPAIASALTRSSGSLRLIAPYNTGQADKHLVAAPNQIEPSRASCSPCLHTNCRVPSRAASWLNKSLLLGQIRLVCWSFASSLLAAGLLGSGFASCRAHRRPFAVADG